MQMVEALFYSALAGYTADLGIFTYRVGFAKHSARPYRWILYGAFALHTLALTVWSFYAKECPLFTVQGSLWLMAWLTILVCLILGLRYHLNALEGFAPVLAIVLMGASALMQSRILVPLNLPSKMWVSLHAAMYFIGYTAFAIAFLAGCMYLILEYQLKKRHLNVFTGDLGNLALMDKIQNVFLRWGVLCLTGGIAVGIGLLKEVQSAWLTTVWTDPKMAVALFTWALYLGLVFVRSTNRLRGRKAAYISMASFALVFVTFLSIQHLEKVF